MKKRNIDQRLALGCFVIFMEKKATSKFQSSRELTKLELLKGHFPHHALHRF